MNDTRNGHARCDDGTEICWTLLLQPKLKDGYLPGRVDLSPPPPTGTSHCVGAYPRFKILQASDCACGLIGDGKSVLDAEYYIRSFSDRKGVSHVDIAWHWGAKAPPRRKAKRVALDAFCRMNERHSLQPDQWYAVSLTS